MDEEADDMVAAGGNCANSLLAKTSFPDIYSLVLCSWGQNVVILRCVVYRNFHTIRQLANTIVEIAANFLTSQWRMHIMSS